MSSAADRAAACGKLVVIGGSAGGVDALHRLIVALPAPPPFIVAAVLHRSPYFEGALPAVLARGTRQIVREPNSGDRMEPGVIYVAPRDRHMVTADGRLQLHRGPREHHTRPAIDPLFQSAARAYGPCALGVVLSGGGDDGTDGLIAIKAAGGISIVQNPDEAMQPWMPSHAISCDHVDLVLPLADIAAALTALSAGATVAATAAAR